MNLDGTSFQVSATGAEGIVSRETRLRLVQRGARVLGRYHGGTIRRGYLVGELLGRRLSFRYAQLEASGHVHGGRSVCEVERTDAGRLRLVEHFHWETRAGSGTNVFEQTQE